MPELLIVDDDRAVRRSLEIHLEGRGFSVRTAATLAKGEAAWRQSTPDLVILDLKLPDGEGLELLERMTASGSPPRVLMITGHHEMDKAVAAMRAGAFDYVHKPLSVDELDRVVDRALKMERTERHLGLEIDPRDGPRREGEIVGRSRAILELHKAIGRASRGRANVLIRGESGTGKELVARAIHRLLAPEAPFLALNCSAIVPTLFESELFGHEKGAFTGAAQRQAGRLERAGRGVLFLDEVGDLPLEIQGKLLRAIQEKEFERVGGDRSLPFEAVLIAATHRDLEAGVSAGTFREDLYYRIRVVEIHVPKLRDRKEDIPLLVEHFLTQASRDFHRRVTRVSTETLQRLQAYDWPGNVRELENVIQAGIMASTGEILALDTFAPGPKREAPDLQWRRSLAQVEAEHIREVLQRVDWKLGEACETLGISRPTLRKKIQDHGLDPQASPDD